MLVVAAVHLVDLVVLVGVAERVVVETRLKYLVPVQEVQELVSLIPAVAEVVYTWLISAERVKVVDQELFLLKKLHYVE